MVYLFSKSKKIKFLNIRPTRVDNRVGLFEELNDPDPKFIEEFKNIFTKGKIIHSNFSEKYFKRVKQKKMLSMKVYYLFQKNQVIKSRSQKL